MIEIKPYMLEENGRKFYAECYPFINNRPVPAIAHCRYCSFCNHDDNEMCYGWKDNPQDAPLFCGPVCPKFELISSKQKVLENELIRYLSPAKVLLPC